MGVADAVVGSGGTSHVDAGGIVAVAGREQGAGRSAGLRCRIPGPPFGLEKGGGNVRWTGAFEFVLSEDYVEGEGGAEEEADDDGEL